MCSWLQRIWSWNREHTYLRSMSHLIYLVQRKKSTNQTKCVMTSGPFTGSYHLMCENHLTISESWTSTCWTLKCSCFFPHLLQPKYVLYPKYLHEDQRGVGIFFIKVVFFLVDASCSFISKVWVLIHIILRAPCSWGWKHRSRFPHVSPI